MNHSSSAPDTSASRASGPAGASDGAVMDYGPMLSVHFTDPDGMGCEVCWLRDPSLAGFHTPERYTGPLADEPANGR